MPMGRGAATTSATRTRSRTRKTCRRRRTSSDSSAAATSIGQPYSTEHQSLQVNVLGRGGYRSRAGRRSSRHRTSSSSRRKPFQGVARRRRPITQYINYSINLIHHYTGLSWLDATTSAGFVREKRGLINPETVSQNLLAGLDNPASGTVQTNFYNSTAAHDQSLYARSSCCSLDSRLSVAAGVTAERSTNDGHINKFYCYPHYRGLVSHPAVRLFIDELKLRAAYGQSGTAAATTACATQPTRPRWMPGLPGEFQPANCRRSEHLARVRDGDRDWASMRRCSTPGPSSPSQSTRSGSRTCCCEAN